MSGEPYTVILFHATSHALRAEKVLDRAGIKSKLIPVPRQLSSDCGACLRIRRADRDAAQAALQTALVQIDSLHDL